MDRDEISGIYFFSYKLLISNKWIIFVNIETVNICRFVSYVTKIKEYAILFSMFILYANMILVVICTSVLSFINLKYFDGSISVFYLKMLSDKYI